MHVALIGWSPKNGTALGNVLAKLNRVIGVTTFRVINHNMRPLQNPIGGLKFAHNLSARIDCYVVHPLSMRPSVSIVANTKIITNDAGYKNTIMTADDLMMMASYDIVCSPKQLNNIVRVAIETHTSWIHEVFVYCDDLDARDREYMDFVSWCCIKRVRSVFRGTGIPQGSHVMVFDPTRHFGHHAKNVYWRRDTALPSGVVPHAYMPVAGAGISDSDLKKFQRAGAIELGTIMRKYDPRVIINDIDKYITDKNAPMVFGELYDGSYSGFDMGIKICIMIARHDLNAVVGLKPKNISRLDTRRFIMTAYDTPQGINCIALLLRHYPEIVIEMDGFMESMREARQTIMDAYNKIAVLHQQLVYIDYQTSGQ